MWSGDWRDPEVPAQPAGRRRRPAGGWRSCGGGHGGGWAPAIGGRAADARPGARAGGPAGCRTGRRLGFPGWPGPARGPSSQASRAAAQRSWISTWRCLVPLPDHGDHPAVQVDVGHVEPAQLGHPDPAPVEQLQARRRPGGRPRRAGPVPGSGSRLQQLGPARRGRAPGEAGSRGRGPTAGSRGRSRSAPARCTSRNRSGARRRCGRWWPWRSAGWPGRPGSAGA